MYFSATIFCSWLYWLLKAELCITAQMCDARNDDQNAAVWLKKKYCKNGALVINITA